MTGPLVSAPELAALQHERDLRILDASWRLDGSDARAAHRRARAPGARFFDLEAVSDPSSPLPHMLSQPEHFAAAMGALGVTERDNIVVYDDCGLFSAPRAWWMLKAMGAGRVRVLDGGLPAWVAAGLPVQEGPEFRAVPAVFRARPRPEMIVDRAGVAKALVDSNAVILDARPRARFMGEAPEPRPGLAAGHMPGARNLPFTALTEEGRMKSPDVLTETFRKAGLGDDQTVVTSCGSGLTAAILTLALAVLGRDSRLYDASWAEWGAPGGGPVVTDDNAPPPP